MTNKKAKQDKKKAPDAANKVVDDLPSDAELDALQEEINKAKAAIEQREEEKTVTPEHRIEQLETEIATLKDQALRAMAEAENVKKRAEREVVAAKTYGIERFAMDVLSVHDNLSRALLSLEGKAKADLGENAQNLLAGIELTEKDLILICLLYTSPSPRDRTRSRMPSSA